MNTKITYEEFVNKVDKLHEQVKQNWRYGQTYFSVLSSVRSDLAETIRATIYDPFHKEKIPKETEKLLRDKWDA
jgi:hypothetical protein